MAIMARAVFNENQRVGSLDFSVRLMEHLVVPTFVLDAECRVIIWNRACERLTGIPAAELIGTREHWRAFYGEPRPCLADLIAQGRTEEIDKLYTDWDHAGRDAVPAHGRRAENWCVMPQMGTRLYLAIDAGPIYDESGQLVAVVETLRDITVQKVAQDELKRLATRDGLTGVANRRCFDETLASEWLRCTRDVKPLSLILLDVDHFKRYNDTFGHLGGDACLKTIASALAISCHRSADLIARYGGEEFAAVLPGTTVAGALTLAERIRADIAALEMPHPGNDGVGRVSISLGVATVVPDRTLELDCLIDAADRALYAAKRSGRNRALHAEQIDVRPCRLEIPAG
ncbi:MAG: diguanylate cyclase [Rhodocyclaceae bacterium]|nr:diguanylate cyclase [Rhodocyclaceae bacterium]